MPVDSNISVPKVKSDPHHKTPADIAEPLTFWLEPASLPRLLEHHTAALRRWRALFISTTVFFALVSGVFLLSSLWVTATLFASASGLGLLIATAFHVRSAQRRNFLQQQARALHVTLGNQLELHNSRWSLALAYDDIRHVNWCSAHQKRRSNIPTLCVITPAFTVLLQGFARSEGLQAALEVLTPEPTPTPVSRARAILLTGVGLLLAFAFWQRHHPWGLTLPPLLLFAADLYALRLPQPITGLERFRPRQNWYMRPRIALTLLTIAWSVWLVWF